jgi:hypothetical protein
MKMPKWQSRRNMVMRRQQESFSHQNSNKLELLTKEGRQSAYGEDFNKPSTSIVLRVTNARNTLTVATWWAIEAIVFHHFVWLHPRLSLCGQLGGFRLQGAVALGVGPRSPEPRTSFLFGATQTPVDSTRSPQEGKI